MRSFLSSFLVISLAASAICGSDELPAHVDWREVAGMVSPVRDQG